jgi:transporter family-2 protein
MGDSLEAALVSFGSGLIFVSLISAFKKEVRAGFSDIFKAVKDKSLSSWRLGAGVLGASFVAMQTHVVPIAGVALFTVASLAGQAAISLWVDHTGLMGNGKNLVTIRRVLAAVITVLAVIVSAWDRFSMSNFSILAILLAIFAGGLVGVQRALNGQINYYSKRSFATSQLNFITGPWWMFLGGSIGVVYIAFSAAAVQRLGVLDFTLFSVGGMLVGSLLIDLVAPTAGTVISWYLIAGILLTYLGVIANSQTRRSRR